MCNVHSTYTDILIHVPSPPPSFPSLLSGCADVIVALIAGGADVNKIRTSGSSPVYTASKHGHAAAVQALIRGGADVNREKVTLKTTPLYIACKRGHVEVVRALLRPRNVDVNKAQRGGATPGLTASHYGHVVCIELLVEVRRRERERDSGRERDACTARVYDGDECLIYLLLLPCMRFASTEHRY